MSRLNLNNLSSREREELAELIQVYATPRVVEEHWNAALAGVHENPVTFLSFHRGYLNNLETYLRAEGHPEWVPLPAWNPAEPIPAEFNIPDTGPGRLRNLDPRVSFSPEFDSHNLVNFQSEAELGEALIPRHNEVHARVGGIMSSVRNAPRAPIFWPFHSFIDDIWWEWERITVTVPSCVGMPYGKAKNLLGFSGLEIVTNNYKYLPVWALIKNQVPAPLTKAHLGTKVTLQL